MLAPRTDSILKSIVGEYITKAVPVSSHTITIGYDLGVSEATIRNEMAYLEHEGYIIRRYASAGSVPSDRGYRYYVESLGEVKLPLAEQRLISHLFHQVEGELGEWLNLATSLIAQMVKNVAVTTVPKPETCLFKYLELVALKDSVALVILVLSGVRIRQRLITFDQAVPQLRLRAVAGRLSTIYASLTSSEILAKDIELSSIEQQVTDYLVEMMQAEDIRENEVRYLDGVHFMLGQPEFASNQRMLALMELLEQRRLLRSILPQPSIGKVQVIIGEENKEETIHDYSVVLSHYGLLPKAIGTIGVIGPTRMPYARTIATLDYLSSVLSELVAGLYEGTEPSAPKSGARVVKRRRVKRALG